MPADFHVVPLDDGETSLLIETDTTIEDVPLCDRCGAVVGDVALHEEWHNHLGTLAEMVDWCKNNVTVIVRRLLG